MDTIIVGVDCGKLYGKYLPDCTFPMWDWFHKKKTIFEI